MKMSWSIGMSVLSLQHPSHNAAGWNWIADHLDGGEPESAILVCREFAAQIHVGLFRVLVLVEAAWRGVPDVDFGARDRLPAVSTTRAVTSSGSPGVSDRTIVPPLATRGEFSRQNGPSSDCDVSVLPLPPLLRRQTSEETPSEPAISTDSLCVSVLSLPISLRIAVAWRNSSSVSRTSRMKMCRCFTRDTRISRTRGSAVRSIAASASDVTSSWLPMIIATLPRLFPNCLLFASVAAR